LINKQEFKDPFEPPIDDDILIDEDFTENHRLCFNKFPVVDCHLLLPTKQNLNQYTHLAETDFTSMLYLMRVIGGYGLFNGGINAGASQPHKHLQCIPYEYNKDYGIFLLLKKEQNLTKIESTQKNENFTFYKLNVFVFDHLFVKFSPEFSEKLLLLNKDTSGEFAKVIHEVYNYSISSLGLKNDPEKITKDYSLMLTEEWMLIVPRKTFKLELENGELNLNSACYTLSILVKSEKIREEVKQMKITEIFRRLSEE